MTNGDFATIYTMFSPMTKAILFYILPGIGVILGVVLYEQFDQDIGLMLTGASFGAIVMGVYLINRICWHWQGKPIYKKDSYDFEILEKLFSDPPDRRTSKEKYGDKKDSQLSKALIITAVFISTLGFLMFLDLEFIPGWVIGLGLLLCWLRMLWISL